MAIEAAKERESLAQLGQRFSVHPVMVGEWKRQLLEKAELAFAWEARGDAERAHDDLLKGSGSHPDHAARRTGRRSGARV